MKECDILLYKFASKCNLCRYMEPEIAFADLNDDMQCAEDYVRFCLKYVLEHCRGDLEFFAKMYDKDAINRVKEAGAVSYPTTTTKLFHLLLVSCFISYYQAVSYPTTKLFHLLLPSCFISYYQAVSSRCFISCYH
jgi:hypothetical protein